MPLSVGDKLGPYEILAPIGAGGTQHSMEIPGIGIVLHTDKECIKARRPQARSSDEVFRGVVIYNSGIVSG